jgi:hypothetical protein
MVRRRVPMEIHSVKKTRMINPKVFKSEQLELWDATTNVQYIWSMVRNRPGQSLDKSSREGESPTRRIENPVQFNQQWISLHITPRVVSSTERDVNKIQIRDKLIEHIHLSNVPSRFISIIWVPNEIKISPQNPIIKITGIQIH